MTFDSLREALSDEDLRELLHRTFQPGRSVSVKQTIKSSTFAEDFYLEPTVKKVKRVKGTVPKKAIKPSERYEADTKSFLQGAEPTAETVLGFFFSMYKRYFHEEDPDWAGTSTVRAVNTVKRLADEVTDGNYQPILNYTRKLFPLWVKRLKQGHEFPNNRPTINSMFGGNRYFWANRKLLYKRWQER